MSHNLHRIESSIDMEEIGDSRQIKGVVSPYLVRSPVSFLRLNDPSTDICKVKLPRFELSDRANLTDFMDLSYSGNFKLISPRFKSIIEDHRVDNVDFYTVEVVDFASKLYDYFLITSRRKVAKEVIDWNKSSFTWWDMYSNKIEEKIYNINSYSDWFLYWTDKVPRKSDKWRVRFTDLVMHEYGFDFAKLSSPLLGFFVSTKLKCRIEEEHITGLAFSPLNNYEVKHKENIN